MDTNFNFIELSSTELDDIAVKQNSIVGQLSIEDRIGRSKITSDTFVDDWKCKWIDTRGSDFKGMLILRPTNSRTKRLAVEGRCNNIVSTYGVSNSFAMHVVKATHGIQWVNETNCMALIVNAYKEPFWDGCRILTKFNGSENIDSDLEWINHVKFTYGDVYPELNILDDIKILAVGKAVSKLKVRLTEGLGKRRLPWGNRFSKR